MSVASIAYLLALLGQPASIATEHGVCTGTVIGLAQVRLDGPCQLEPGSEVYVGDDSEESEGTVRALGHGVVQWEAWK